MPSDGFQVGAVGGREVVAARGYEIDLSNAMAAPRGLRLCAQKDSTGADPLRALRRRRPPGESYGAVFAKGRRLRVPVNRAIAALRKDGTLKALGARRLTSDLPRLPVLR